MGKLKPIGRFSDSSTVSSAKTYNWLPCELLRIKHILPHGVMKKRESSYEPDFDSPPGEIKAQESLD